MCCLDPPLCSPTAGTYKPTVGSAPCTDCTAGKYGTILGAEGVGNCASCTQANYQPGRGSTACLSCGIATTSNGAFTECICREGYTGPDGGLCAACPFDKYKNTTGSTPCIPCAAGKFSKQPGLASTICLTCAEDPTNEPCRDCPAGKFRNGTQINILRPEAQAIVDWGRAHNLSPNGTTVNPIPNCGGTQRTGDKCRCPAGDACLECRRCKIWH